MASKKTGIILALAAFSFVALSSCGGMFGKGGSDSAAIKAELEKALTENTNLIEIDSAGYSMNIPKHMTKTTELNDDASLQYQDAAQELYVICIDEAKTDFIKTFSDADLDPQFTKYDDKLTPEKNYRVIQMEIMKGKMKLKSEPVVKKATINGLDAEIVDFTANVEGIDYDIYYKLAFIEGTKNMYMVMTWTLDSKKNSNMDEMDQMLNSFKLKK